VVLFIGKIMESTKTVTYQLREHNKYIHIFMIVKNKINHDEYFDTTYTRVYREALNVSENWCGTDKAYGILIEENKSYTIVKAIKDLLC
tara:strand:+ start:23612 stop:23878 length:267 start_codon:yes stop_codon:yes gene_type:complete